MAYLWGLSYPGQRGEWEGRFSHTDEDVHEEYATSSYERSPLLDHVLERVRAQGFSEEVMISILSE
jgi:hypothetical protein